MKAKKRGIKAKRPWQGWKNDKWDHLRQKIKKYFRKNLWK